MSYRSDFEKLAHYKAKMDYYGGQLGLEDLEGSGNDQDILASETKIKQLVEELNKNNSFLGKIEYRSDEAHKKLVSVITKIEDSLKIEQDKLEKIKQAKFKYENSTIGRLLKPTQKAKV